MSLGTVTLVRPACVPCEEMHAATYLLPIQKGDGWEYQPVCSNHARGWFDTVADHTEAPPCYRLAAMEGQGDVEFLTSPNPQRHTSQVVRTV